MVTQIGSLTGWHNISSSASPTTVNGVFFQDIVSILRVMERVRDSDTWELIRDALYKHIVDFHNPHKVTPDQLPTKCIEILYNLWLDENYNGTLEEFTTILFRFLTVATWEDMLEGTSEDKITPVKLVSMYVERHNNDLYGAHIEILNSITLGDPNCIREPTLALNNFLDIPYKIKRTQKNILDHQGNLYAAYNYKLNNGCLGSEVSFILEGDYVSGLWLNLKSEAEDSYYQIRLNSETHTVTFVVKTTDAPETTFDLDIHGLVEDLAGSVVVRNNIILGLVLDGIKMHGYAQLTGRYIDVPIQSKILHLSLTNVVTVPVAQRPTANTRLIIPRMEPNDYLRSFTYYAEALKDENLSFIFGVFD